VVVLDIQLDGVRQAAVFQHRLANADATRITYTHDIGFHGRSPSRSQSDYEVITVDSPGSQATIARTLYPLDTGSPTKVTWDPLLLRKVMQEKMEAAGRGIGLYPARYRRGDSGPNRPSEIGGTRPEH